MGFCEVQNKLQGYFKNNVLFNESIDEPDGDESLIDSGYIDSTGIIGLVAFLERTFHIKVYDDEVVPENFDSINRIFSFVSNKAETSHSSGIGGTEQ